MIVNVRGTNGSGKSTLVRHFLTYPNTRIIGLCGPRNPEAYEITVPNASRQLYLLGPYWTPTGGCDAIQPYNKILDLLDKYAPKGHVLFEGSLVSDNYGVIGEWLTSHVDLGVVVFFLNTPLEECLTRLRGRTEGAGEKHVAKRFEAIKRVRTRFLAEGKVQVADISSDNTAAIRFAVGV